MIDSLEPFRSASGPALALFAAAWLSACGSQQGTAAARCCPCSASLDLDRDQPVAEVEGKVITYGELLRAAESDLRRARAEHQTLSYRIEEEVLGALIDQQLLAARAESEGLTPEQLLQREVQAGIEPPSDEEIRAEYEDTNIKYNGLLPPFEESRADLRQQWLKQRQQEAREEFFERLRSEAQIKFLLPPLIPAAVPVPVDGPSRGPAEAAVTMVEFADFECPFCVKAQATVELILETYPDRVRYVFRDFPLSFHRFAAKAAEAAHCAADQNKYWEMHDLLFDHSDALGVEDLKAYAAELGLDSARFDACLDSSEKASLVEQSIALGRKLGISGSPSFFINGRLITGAQPFSRFQELIEAELSAAGR